MNRPKAPASAQGAGDIESIRDILRQRMATDDLLGRFRNASNALAAGLSIDIPGLQPACSASHTRARRIANLLWAAKRKARVLREQQLSDLPDLTQEQIDILAHLDGQILLLAPALSDWFEGKFPLRSRLGKSPGDWIEIDERVSIEFKFGQDFDPELAQVWQLVIGCMFGGVICRLGRPIPGDARSHFEFQPFADELKTVERREHVDIKSDLLLAVLPRIPELAFAAKFVERLSLRMGDSRFTAAIAKLSGQA